MSEHPAEDDLPEQVRVRREKRQRMLDTGVAPYPIAVDRTHTLAEVRAAYDGQQLEPDTRTGQEVAVAGRVMFLRNTGKLCFVRLREGDGTELQVMLSAADIGADRLAELKADVDLGDLLAVRGEVVTSRRGELSVQAHSWSLAAKTLRPLPNEHRPLSRRGPGPAALRRHDRAPRAARHGAHQGRGAAQSLRATLDEPRLHRGGDADPAADQRRRGGTAVPDAPERVRPGRCCCGSRSSSTSSAR